MFCHALTFAGSGGSCLNTRLSVQTSSKGPRSFNAMKQTCVIVVLLIFTLIQPYTALKTSLEH